LLGDVGRFDRFDGPPMEMQAGLREFGLRCAESQFDRNFIGLHGVDCLERPQHDKCRGDQSEDGRAGATAARQGAPQPVLAAPDDVFEIGRRALRAARPLRSLPPGSLIAAATPRAAAAALVIPGHKCPFAWNSLKRLFNGAKSNLVLV
jgi:hypothetical protein